MKTTNIHYLFGWEAVQARPNCDPFTNELREFEETGQIYTSEEHFKHHVRRGLVAAVGEMNPDYADKPDATVYFAKADESGSTRSAKTRQDTFAKAWGLKKAGSDVSKFAVDLPLFGFVNSVSKNDETTDLLIGSARPLFFPCTPHQCQILGLGINNAFPQSDGKSSGSSTKNILLYGYFLALVELNEAQLKTNIKGHRFSENPEDWVRLLALGMKYAYSRCRFPSVTQRSQFFRRLNIWKADADARPMNPAEKIYRALADDQKLITGSDEADTILDPLIEDYLKEAGAFEQPIEIAAPAVPA